MKKYFYQDFPQLNLKENTKTMTSDCLYLYGALCWSCRSRHSTSLPSTLHQVVFYFRYFLSWCPLHCPITIGRLQSGCVVRPCALSSHATSNGVLLSLFFKLTSAPLSNNNWIASVLLYRAAKCNGVSLNNRFCLFTSAPSYNRSLMTSVRLYSVA